MAITDCVKARQEEEVTMIIAEYAPALVLDTSLSRLPQSSRVALLDSDGKIIAVNNDWLSFAEQSGAELNRVKPGVNYLEICRQAGSTVPASRRAFLGIQDVLKRKTSSFGMDYTCQTPTGLAYFRLRATPIVYADARVVISHSEITDLHHKKETDFKHLQQFARRLIHAHEEERQRLSREMHDDLGNKIALMSFLLRRVTKEHSKKLGPALRDSMKIQDGMAELSTSLRDLSHGLHPAPLRYLGIPAALKSLCDGIEDTCGIQVELAVCGDLPRLPEEVELCIFRITQECLQNATKHSGADKVKVVVEHSPKQLRLTVSDGGRGFNHSEAILKGGLGLLSMEERARGIGGTLTFNSEPGRGTEIRLTLPLKKAAYIVE
jgi:signal transduction histidine kinase